jgi:hypothetical protein
MKASHIAIPFAALFISMTTHAAPQDVDLGGTNIVVLASVRAVLTTNLTYELACVHLGSPWGPVLIHGSMHPQWRLDDGNILRAAFRLVEPHEIWWARVQTPNGKVLEEIIKDRRLANRLPVN